MKLLKKWFTKGERRNDALEEWRRGWAATIGGSGRSDADLRGRLDTLSATESDVEVELEMLDALEQLRTVQTALANGGFPVIETHHRVVGTEPCHFTAPASLRSDQAQSSGRVLLTNARAIFVGGGRTSAAAWHLVRDVARIERDVLVLRSDRTPIAHYRFNTYADAVVCAYLSQQLMPAWRARL